MNREMDNDFLLYREMLLIRRTEERILELFARGKVSGTTHTCMGQEANSVGIIGQLDSQKDFVVSNHRCHGHFIAFGGPLQGLICEILGLESGVCGGRGGSQHLKYGHFFSNGIQGGGAPIACGLALGEIKSGNRDSVTVFCLGDGTLGQGVLYESLNMAALWNLPVLFLLENNGYAQTTPVEIGVSGSITGRASPFGIEADEIESTDVRDIYAFGARAIDFVRTKRKPYWAVVHTCRLCAHSKGDDTRSPDEIEILQSKDPLSIQGRRLSSEERSRAQSSVDLEMTAVFERIGMRFHFNAPEGI
jgi:TPP-dependent pyruvate/acetoin dehydrogenase alpha subunit